MCAMDERETQKWDIHTMEYCSILKEWSTDKHSNVVSKRWKHDANWKKPGTEGIHCMTPIIWNIQNR